MQTRRAIRKPEPGNTPDFKHPIARGLVGCWLFNEGAGLRAYDSSLKRFHGTLTNTISFGESRNAGAVTPGTNPPGPVIIIPNTTGVVTLPNMGLGGNPPISVFQRFNANQDSRLFTFGTAGTRFAFGQSMPSSTVLRLFFFGDDMDTTVEAYYGRNIDSAIVWNPAANTRYQYMNGVLRGSGSPAGTPGFIDANYEIGNLVASPGNYNGTIDFVYVWNRALTAAEISTLHHFPFIMWERVDRSGPGRPTLFLNERLPWESVGPLSVPDPYDWRGTLSALRQLPYLFTDVLIDSGETFPYEWSQPGGGFSLGLSWNDLLPLNVPLTLQWNVLAAAVIFSLTLQWNGMQALAGLSLRWSALPDVFTPFGIDPQTGLAITPAATVFTPSGQPIPGGVPSEDIHKPVGHVTKTP